MAGTCNTASLTNISTSRTDVAGSFGGNTPGFTVSKSDQYGISVVTENQVGAGTSTAAGGGWTKEITGLTADTTYLFRAVAEFDLNWGIVNGNTLSGKTNANVATMPAPGSSAVAATTATITSNAYTPNVVTSTYTVSLYYKKTSDPSYTLAGSGTANPLAANLTGLTASTQYQFYAEIVRTTANDTTATSSVGSFTTLADEPEVTTEAASSVGATSATLNSVYTKNGAGSTPVDLYFKYDTVSPPVANTSSVLVAIGSGAWSKTITGLSASTLYYFQAYVDFTTPPTGSPNSGSIQSFTTDAVDPNEQARDEDHLTNYEYDAVYGVQKAFVFSAAVPSGTNSNKFYTGAAPWATTECIILHNGALSSVVNPDGRSTNAPTQIGSSAYYTITLTAAELAFENVRVHISDSSTAARDVMLHIRTSQELGKLVLNAAQMTNTTALLATGVGSGHGISGVAGATGKDIDGVLGSHVIRKGVVQAGGASTVTLDASASATNDFYNGALVVIISGTGTAQSRFIADYDGGTKVATVHRAWSTNPAVSAVFIIVPAEDVWAQTSGAELSGIPTAVSSWADKLAFVFQRFAYKRTQTSVLHTMMKADGTTPLGTATVSDLAGTQSFGTVS